MADSKEASFLSTAIGAFAYGLISPVIVATHLVALGIDAVADTKLSDAMDKATDASIRGISDFVTEHSETIDKAVIGSVVTVVTGDVSNLINKNKS